MPRPKKNRDDVAPVEATEMQEQTPLEPEVALEEEYPPEDVAEVTVEAGDVIGIASDDVPAEDQNDQPEPDSPDKEDDGVINLTLSLPVSMFEQSPGSMQRLKAAISSKQTLLKKALGTESLDVVIEGDCVTFPWFTTTEADSPVDVDAYSKLVFALAKKAITQTRVDPVEKVPDDLQLGMRLYLINLNFKGDEFKNARAVLMRNFRTASGGPANPAKYELTMPEVYKP